MADRAKRELCNRLKKAILRQPIRRRRKFFVLDQRCQSDAQVSLRGLAFLCAIEAGMVQKASDGGYDSKPFLQFWGEFSKFIREARSGYPKEMRDVIELIQKRESSGRAGPGQRMSA